MDGLLALSASSRDRTGGNIGSRLADNAYRPVFAFQHVPAVGQSERRSIERGVCGRTRVRTTLVGKIEVDFRLNDVDMNILLQSSDRGTLLRWRNVELLAPF